MIMVQLRYPLQQQSAEQTRGLLDEEAVSFIKGMLLRGDKQSDISAFFMVNTGRISEINNGQRHADVPAAPKDALPPCGTDYTPYEIWRCE